MSAASSWPPPPNIPYSPPVHDAFLTACVLDTSKKQMLTRLSLAVKLRRESGLGFWACRAIVADFCERHAIMPSLARVQLWVGGLLGLIGLATFLTMSALFRLNEKEFAAAATPAAVAAVVAKSNNVTYAGLGVCPMVLCIAISFEVWRVKKQQRDAEHARRTLAAQAAAPT